MSPATSRKKKTGTIFWAVDPTQNPKNSSEIIKELRVWKKATGCQVQPVSVFSESSLEGGLSHISGSRVKRLDRVIQAPLRRYLKKAQVDDFLPAQELLISGNSTRKMAYAMAQFALKEGARFIFVNTRGKNNEFSLRLGSFAETLIATSKVPVVTMNPGAVANSKISSFLFPLDFTNEAKNALFNLAPWVQLFKAKIHLYNQVEKPPVFYPDYSLNNFRLYESDPSLEEITKTRKKTMQSWVENLKRKNIKVTSSVDLQKESLAAEIVDFAKNKNTNVIVLVNRSGPFAQAIVGGVAKDVLLKAKCPVLTFFRPQKIKT